MEWVCFRLQILHPRFSLDYQYISLILSPSKAAAIAVAVCISEVGVFDDKETSANQVSWWLNCDICAASERLKFQHLLIPACINKPCMLKWAVRKEQESLQVASYRKPCSTRTCYTRQAMRSPYLDRKGCQPHLLRIGFHRRKLVTIAHIRSL